MERERIAAAHLATTGAVIMLYNTKIRNEKAGGALSCFLSGGMGRSRVEKK
jgi:hypothetical protein